MADAPPTGEEDLSVYVKAPLANLGSQHLSQRMTSLRDKYEHIVRGHRLRVLNAGSFAPYFSNQHY